MATLEKIRSRGGLLIIIIGFALAAFIVGDMLKSGSSFLGESQREIAEINGNSVMIDEFQRRVEELSDVYKMNTGQSTLDAATMDQINAQVWTNLVQEFVMKSEYEELGIAVSSDELFDLYVGENPHPIAQSMFKNPETGVYDRSFALNFLKSLESDDSGQRSAYQLFLEKEIVGQKKIEKYNTLIAKALNVNSKELALDASAKKEKKNIEFFSKSYYSIPDSLVSVSDSELASFYNAHQDRYKQGESREAEYISFNILPSDEDIAEINKWSNNVKAEMQELSTVAEVKQYVALNSDVPFNDVNISSEDIPSVLKTFVAESEVGAVYGPFIESKTYKLAKIAAFNMSPDSVEARHILVRAETPEAQEALADSLITLINSGASTFAQVAANFSQDTGSKDKAGELGWFKEGMMVREFSDACFNGKKNDLTKVVSQYGLHIVEVLNQSPVAKKVKLAIVQRELVPSTETYRNIYAQASKFVGENNSYEKFQAAIDKDGMKKQFARNIGKNDKKVGALESPRELVRWAYGAELNTISPIFEFGDKFVLATLTKVSDEGVRPIADVTSLIKAELLKDKKAEKIIADINSKKGDSQTLTSLAQKVGATIKSADGITFASFQVPGAGIEPGLVGAISVAAKDAISEPVKGVSGVFVFRVTSSEVVDLGMTPEMERQNIMRQNAYRVNYQAFNALKEKAEIVDNRARFY